MRTSRISQESAKLFNALSSTGRRTSSRLRANSSALTSDTGQSGSLVASATIKNEILDDEPTAASTITVSTAGDIEDSVLPSSSKKRKRGAETPPTSVTASPTPKRTSRRAAVKVEETTITPLRQKKARKQPAKKVKKEDGEVEIHAPPNWQELYNTCLEMRKNIVAPVDTMGCETLAQENISPRACFTTALILSAC